MLIGKLVTAQRNSFIMLVSVSLLRLFDFTIFNLEKNDSHAYVVPIAAAICNASRFRFGNYFPEHGLYKTAVYP